MKISGRNLLKRGLDKLPKDVLKELKKATTMYKDFHWGKDVDKITKMEAPEPPRVLVALGYLRSVTYQTQKEGDEGDMFYIHAFERPFPILCTDPEGKHLFIVGGGFKVKKEGIVG